MSKRQQTRRTFIGLILWLASLAACRIEQQGLAGSDVTMQSPDAAPVQSETPAPHEARDVSSSLPTTDAAVPPRRLDAEVPAITDTAPDVVDAAGEPLTRVDAASQPAPHPSFSTCDPKDPSLLLCLSFDEDDPVLDRSSHRHAASTANLVFLADTPSGVGRSVLMTATPAREARLLFGHHGPSSAFDVQEFTLELSAKVAIDRPTEVTGLINNDGEYFLVVRADGTVSCGIWTDDMKIVNVVTGTPVLDAKRWVHLRCVHDGTSLALLVDGKLAGDPVPTAGARIRMYPGTLTIGHDAPHGANYVGLLDDVRIWSRPLRETTK